MRRQKITFLVASLFILSASFTEAKANNSGIKNENSVMQQKAKVSGTVTDAQGALAGVTITEVGTKNGTISDQDGKFSLSTSSSNAKLKFSYLGYKTITMPVNGRKVMSIKMSDADASDLGAVVITAMGIKKEERSITYAQTQLKPEQITAAAAPDLGAALYGKVPGLQITGSASGATGGVRLQLRGINSLQGSNRPLIIVDGIPMSDTDSGLTGRDRNSTDQGSALNDINPEDIASLNVLKGANAAALYGSQAANGVIIITTKKGSKSSGLGVSVSEDYTFNQNVSYVDWQNDFGGGKYGALAMTKDANGKDIAAYPNTQFSFGPRMQGQPVLWYDGTVRNYSAQPNNYRDMFQNGFTNNTGITISKGGEKNSIHFSYRNSANKGYTPNATQTKNNFSLGATSKISDRVTTGFSVLYTTQTTMNPPTRMDRGVNYMINRSEVVDVMRANAVNSQGYFKTPGMANGMYGNTINNIVSPLFWEATQNSYSAKKDHIVASADLTVKLFDFLSLKASGGTDRATQQKENKEKATQYVNPNIITATGGTGSYLKRTDINQRDYGQAMLMFNKDINKDININATLGTSYQSIYSSWLQGNTNGMRIENFFSLSNSKNGAAISKGARSNELNYAVFGTAEFGYKHYLYLDLTARNDWWSSLPINNDSYFYPSVGVSYVFSDHFRKQLPSWITYGKARLSWAQVGNKPPSTYFVNSTYSDVTAGQAIISTFSSSVPPSADFRPEQTRSWEGGLQMKFLQNRLGFDFTYYSSVTKDQIMSMSVPLSSGASTIKVNGGSLQNTGLELQLTGVPVETKSGFRWESTINFSHNSNKVVSLIPGVDVLNLGNPWGISYQATPGQPSFDIYIRPWERDDKGNKIVDNDGKYIQSKEYAKAGNGIPTVVGGFMNTFTYKKFSMFVAIDMSFGGDMVSLSNAFLTGQGDTKQSLFGRDEQTGGLPYYVDSNHKKILLPSGVPAPSGATVFHDGIIADGVKKDGTKNDIVMSAEDYYYNRYGDNSFSTEEVVQRNNYIKLRQMSFDYTLPTSFIHKIGLQSMKVGLIARNIGFLYKSVPNIDPESVLGTSGYNSSFEYSLYPSVRNLGFSIKASF